MPSNDCSALRQHPFEPEHREGCQRHGQDDDGGERGVVARGDDAGRGRGGIEHEGELAALGEQRRAVERLGVGRPQDAGHEIDADGLHEHVGEHAGNDEGPFASDHRQVERHAHAEKEQPEQDAAERLDIGFELVAEGQLGQQHPRQEGPQRHGEAAELHQERGAEHNQQGGGRHHLAGLSGRQDAKQRVEQPHASRDQTGQRRRADGHADPGGVGRRGGRIEGHERQQRHDGEVLQQEDGHHLLAVRRGGIAPLVEHLDDDGGGRQHKSHGGNEGDQGAQPSGNADEGQQRAAHGDLGSAQPENLPAQAPEPGRLHLQADDEQEHHHAQLGDMQNGLRIGEQAKAIGPDQQPAGQVAEHGAQTQAAEDRNRDDARPEQGHDFYEFGGAFSCHAVLLHRRHRTEWAKEPVSASARPRARERPRLPYRPRSMSTSVVALLSARGLRDGPPAGTSSASSPSPTRCESGKCRALTRLNSKIARKIESRPADQHGGGLDIRVAGRMRQHQFVADGHDDDARHQQQMQVGVGEPAQLCRGRRNRRCGGCRARPRY